MEGKFATPIGHARKATLDNIANYTNLMSAILGTPVTCGRTVPYHAARPATLPAGNYCVSQTIEEPDKLFTLATRLVFSNESGETLADYRSLVLGGLSGVERAADMVTVYEHGMDHAHNRKSAVLGYTDKESINVLINIAETFPPKSTYFVA